MMVNRITLLVASSFEVARRKLLLAEEQTDLSTDCETSKRNRKYRKKRQHSSDTSEEEEIAPTCSGIKPFPQAPSPRFGTDLFAESQSQQIKKNKVSHVDTESCFSKSSSSSGTLKSAISENILAAEVSEFHKKVNRDLSFIKIHLIKLSQTVDAISKKHFVQEEEVAVIEEDNVMQDFPLTTEDKLEQMEEKLKSLELKKKLAQKLSQIGGYGVDHRTKLLLQRIFADNLAAKFSWVGAKKKKVFAKLILATLILDVVQKKESCSEQEVVKSIKNWLRHAPTRSNNKEKKLEQPGERETEIDIL